ncbi:hypothetical protein ACRAWF_09050 [Streptomyces sp. L7]
MRGAALLNEMIVKAEGVGMGFNPIAGILKRRLLIVFLAIVPAGGRRAGVSRATAAGVSGRGAAVGSRRITAVAGRSTAEVEQQITIPIESLRWPACRMCSRSARYRCSGCRW